MTIQDIIHSLETAEEELKVLLASTPPAISLPPKNKQDYVSDALEETQFAISCLLKAKQL